MKLNCNIHHNNWRGGAWGSRAVNEDNMGCLLSPNAFTNVDLRMPVLKLAKTMDVRVSHTSLPRWRVCFWTASID